MTPLLETARSREELVGHDGRSGARLERIRTADGRSLIVKWLDPGQDLAMRATGDTVGREHLLWQAGILDRLPTGVGHPVVTTWLAESGAVIAMRDLTGHMLGWATRLDLAQCRRVLAAVTRMHEAFVDVPIPDACPLATRIAALSPQRMRPFAETFPLALGALRGWACFAELAPADVRDAISHVHEQPDLLAGPMLRRRTTFIHGDLSLPNIALEPDQVTLLDWALATVAPAEYELAWFLADSGRLIDAAPEQILAEFQTLSGDGYDPVAMRLSMLAALSDLGWSKALNAAVHPDPAARERSRRNLNWWCNQARGALDLL